MSDTNTLQTTQAPEELAVAEQMREGDWWIPAVDVTENFDEICIVASMPGVLQEDIQVTFEKDLLRLHARVRDLGMKDGEFLLREFNPGGYERTFRIGEVIDRDRISADYADGVLTIHLPKSESVKPRTIPVTVA